MGNYITNKNKKIICSGILAIGLLTVFLTGCINETSTDRIGVLVTIVPQIEMVESIGGEYVEVTIMVPAGQDPHTYELTPEQMGKIAQANAYFKVGSGVEFELLHMDTILEQNPDLKVFDCSQNINIISYDEHYGAETHQEEYEPKKEEKHEHEGTDPHIWTSPVNFKKMAEIVYNGLVEMDPTHQEEYYSNYQAYILKLDNLHTNVSNKLQPYAGKSFMVFHPAWGYFGDTYNLKMIAIEYQGNEPQPAAIAEIIKQAQDENITVIFVSPQFSITSAQTIADEIGGSVVFANPLMTDYEETITKLSDDMLKGLEKS